MKRRKEYTPLGDVIQSIQESGQMTQAKLASRTGVPASSISALKTGSKNITKEIIEKFCKIYPTYRNKLEEFEEVENKYLVSEGDLNEDWRKAIADDDDPNYMKVIAENFVILIPKGWAETEINAYVKGVRDAFLPEGQGHRQSSNERHLK